MDYPEFIGGSGVSQSPIADQERTVNWYVEPAESRGASSKAALYPTPGVEAQALILPLMPEPSITSVTNEGTPGATTYGYGVVALLTDGTTHTAIAGGGTATGNATLNGTDFNRITWGAVTNAAFYDVYAQPGGVGDIYLIANNITLTTFDDVGAGGPVTVPPISNTSGVQFLPVGTGRAHFFDTSSQREFAVFGAVFYEITSTNTLIWRGAVTEDGNPATISSNGDAGDELFITSGGNGYLFTVSTSVFATIAALAGIATMGDHIDGYFLALDAATSTLYLSDLYDGATWDPTNFIQRAQQADPWNSFKVAGRYVWLMGTQTGEAWYDAGTSTILVPHPSGVIQYGCAAPFSLEVVAGALQWVGATVNGQGVVLRLAGFTPEAISTFATQVAFNGYSTLADAIGDTYDDLGHTHYILTFPTANKTWAWDAQTQKWHERMTWISESSEEVAWRPLFHAFAFEQHRMLDRQTGSLYVMSSDIATDVDGRLIRRIRRAPALLNELQLVGYPMFQVFLEPGLGLSTGQGSDPMVMMRYSNDGGKTWPVSRTATAGAQGDYLRRVEWYRCGMARNRVFEISVSDPIPWRILGAWLSIKRPAKTEAA